jgi:hypothetical protein
MARNNDRNVPEYCNGTYMLSGEELGQLFLSRDKGKTIRESLRKSAASVARTLDSAGTKARSQHTFGRYFEEIMNRNANYRSRVPEVKALETMCTSEKSWKSAGADKQNRKRLYRIHCPYCDETTIGNRQ